MFISFLYMFWATMCPPSGEITGSRRRLIFWMTVWYAEWNEIPRCIPDSHPHRVINIKRRIDTVISPDDGHIVARNI